MEFAPDVLYTIPENPVTEVLFLAGLEIDSVIFTTWIIMICLVVFAKLATKNLQQVPKPGSLQNVVEAFIGAMDNLVEESMGPKNKFFAPYIGTLTLFLVIANLIGIVPGRDMFNLYVPTASLNTTLALGFVTFVNVHFFAIKRKGLLGYIKGYAEPIVILTPINLIGMVTDPMSLSFRLFGNMMASVVIMGLLMTVVPIIAPGVATIYFDVFAGVLQAFIFAMLTMTYISMEME